jgi:hypothetical protein
VVGTQEVEEDESIIMPKFNVQPSGALITLPAIIGSAPAAITPADALARMNLTCAQWGLLTVPQRQGRLAVLLGATGMASLPIASQRWVTSTMNDILPYCLGAGGGRALIGGLLAPAGVPASGPVDWQRMAITIEQRELRTILGALVPVYPLAVGAKLYHWAAPEAGMGWFREAAKWLGMSGRDYVAEADAATPHDQFLLMKRICEAITNGFNALNIVWHNDPITRATYRNFIAGPPVGNDGHPATTEAQAKRSVFGTNENYGGNIGWYTENLSVGGPAEQPVITDPDRSSNGVGAGILPKNTRRLFNRYFTFTAHTHPNIYLQTVGFNLCAAGSSSGIAPLEVELQTSVQNGFWIIQADVRPDLFASKNSAFPTPTAFFRGDPSPSTISRATVIDPAGQRAPQSHVNWDWRDFVFLNPFPGGEIVAPGAELTASAGPQEYVGYLREMVSGLLARRPSQIIQDSRASVMYSNKLSIESAGSIAAFIAQVSGTSTEIQHLVTTPDPLIDAAANLAFSIGGAASVATSGISAVIGGAVGGALLISNRVAQHGISGLFRDDLGRWKPTFERGWLSGNPLNTTAEGEPTHTVDYPPGFKIYPSGIGLFGGGREGLRTALGLSSIPDEDALSNTEADRILAMGAGAPTEFSRLYCRTTLPSDGFMTESDRTLWIQTHPWCDASLAVMHRSALRKAAPWIIGGLAIATAGGLYWKSRKSKK